MDDLKQQIAEYVTRYNFSRLHSAIGYITPNDMLWGRQPAIFEERRLKLKLAQEQRKLQKNQLVDISKTPHFTGTEDVNKTQFLLPTGSIKASP